MRYLLFTLLVLTVTNVNAQGDPIPFQKNGKWGYFSLDKDKYKSTIVEPQFDSVGIFNGALNAIIVQQNKWGIINKKGIIKIGPEYIHTKLLFNGEVAILEKKGASYKQFIVYLLEQDSILFVAYDEIKEITSEVAAFADELTGKKVIFNKSGEIVTEGDYDEIEAQALFSFDAEGLAWLNNSNSFIVCKDYYKDKYGNLQNGAPKGVLLLFSDAAGNWTQIPLQTYYFHKDFVNDRISLITGDKNGESISLIVDRKDETLRITTVKMSLSYKRSFPIGFIIHRTDTVGATFFDGKELIPPTYRYLSLEPNESYIILRDFENNFDLRVLSGESVIPSGYRLSDSRLVSEREQILILTDEKGRQFLYALEDGTLKFLRRLKKKAYSIISPNYFTAKDGEYYGVFNLEGTQIIPTKFRKISYLKDFCFVCEDDNTKIQLYDLDGNRKLKSFAINTWNTVNYDQRAGLPTRQVPVILLRDTSGLFGLINDKFGMILPFAFKEMRFISDSIVQVVDEANENRLYNLQGNRVGQFNFTNSVGRNSKLYFFEKGTSENLEKMIVDANTFNVKGVYEEIILKESGLIFCRKKAFWGVVNDKGEEASPFIFDKIIETGDTNLFIGLKDDMYSVFNLPTKKFIIDFSSNFEKIETVTETGHFIVHSGIKQGVWSRNREVIIPMLEGKIEFVQGLYRVINNGRITKYYTASGDKFE